MSAIRKLLYPFSLIYATITGIRNLLYDKDLLKATAFDLPVLCVGNLRVGGTGKTPHIEYIIGLLQPDYSIATLSRGYKRNSKGFIIAGATATAATIGDEPMQFHKKFPKITVAVDTDRVRGIQKLKVSKNPPQLILLDDAFQHRSVKAGLNMLLTSYRDLYVNDCILPAGNLRESVSGAKRAQVIIITNCPKTLSHAQQEQIVLKLRPAPSQLLFFTKVCYAQKIRAKKNSIDLKTLKDYDIVLVTGIANPRSLCAFLTEQKCRFIHLKYPDHHRFTAKNVNDIRNTFEKRKATKKIILTTEKDYVRLSEKIHSDSLYYLPITIDFLKAKHDFDQLIKQYVETSLKNRGPYDVG